MRFFIFLVTLVTLSSVSCRKYDTTTKSECIERVFLDSLRYQKSLSQSRMIPDLDSLYLSGDCLHIIVSDSACDGKSWSMKLYDAEKLRYVSPPSRNLNFVFESHETCTDSTIVQRDFSFNVSSLRIDGYNTITLVFPYYNQRVNYSY